MDVYDAWGIGSAQLLQQSAGALCQVEAQCMHVCIMQGLFQPSKAVRKTKIAYTLGQKSTSDVALGQLLDDGVDLFSFDAASTSPADMLSTLNRLRVLANTRKLEVAVMMDTAGPGTRTGALQRQTPLQLSVGEEVSPMHQHCKCTPATQLKRAVPMCPNH